MTVFEIILVILVIEKIAEAVLVSRIKKAVAKLLRRMNDHENYTGFDDFKNGSNQKISDSEALETGDNFEDEVNDI